jgi:hypothetical protein
MSQEVRPKKKGRIDLRCPRQTVGKEAEPPTQLGYRITRLRLRLGSLVTRGLRDRIIYPPDSPESELG